MTTCRGCGRELTFKNDPDKYLKMSDIGCKDDLILMEQQTQAYCAELGRYV